MARKPPRGQLGAADYQALRRMARRIGGMDELIRQAKHAPRRHPKRGRPRGAVTYHIDDNILYGLECICRVAMRERSMSRHAAIGWLVDAILPSLRLYLGQSRRAAVERLYDKLKAKGLDKLPINTNRMTLARDGSCALSTRMPPDYTPDTD